MTETENESETREIKATHKLCLMYYFSGGRAVYYHCKKRCVIKLSLVRQIPQRYADVCLAHPVLASIRGEGIPQ